MDQYKPAMSGMRHKSWVGPRDIAHVPSRETGVRHARSRAGMKTPYVGGLSSLASQPSMFEVMGSPDTTTLCTQPHLWHSNVRQSEPEDFGSSFDNSMRFCWHFGHFGRSMAETCSEATG
jgi:hypothetical protein